MRLSRGKLNSASIGLLYRQMATLIASGVPISEAIQVLGEESENRSIKKIAGSITRELAKGIPLSESLGKYPAVFSDFVLSVFQRHDENKKVSDVLFNMADAAEDAGMIKFKVLRALFFPMVTFAFGIFLLMVITLYVLPVFKDMFEGMGGHLPMPTQLLFGISDWLIQNFIFLFIAFIILLILFIINKRVAYLLSSLLPGFNGLMKRTSAILFTKHLSIMLSFGLPLNEAAKRAADMVKTAVHAKKLAAAADAVSNNKDLGEALASTGIFSKIVLHMIHCGSKSDTLPLVLDEITRFYEKDFDRSLNRFLGLMEISAIFTVGVIIGYIVISMYLPIFRMAGAIV